MAFIDHPILYSDSYYDAQWEDLVNQSKSDSAFWRKYARRKMRRIAKQLLNDVRPRGNMFKSA